MKAELEFSLDTRPPVYIGHGEACVAGWCFAKDRQELTGIGIQINGRDVAGFTDQPREDVAAHFGDVRVSNCGFIVHFSLPLRPATGQLYVVLRKTGRVVFADMEIPCAADIRLAETAGDPYTAWLACNDSGYRCTPSEWRRDVASLTRTPLISIILPTFNTNIYFLDRCIQSVRNQIYPNWQLCIADDHSSDPGVEDYLAKQERSDARIRVVHRDIRGNISAASNSALETASGEQLVLLDHDDELHPQALLETVKWLNANPGARLIYTDEDKIDYYGRRSQPAFKPDFDYDLFASLNYLGHLVCLETELVRRLGGLRTACDGAQDWDLLIRAVESISRAAIHHIPKPLYHWRMHAQSTSMSLASKPYVEKAWFTTLGDHITRKHVEASVERGAFFGSMRLRRRPKPDMRTAVVVRGADGEFQVSSIRAACPSAQAQYFISERDRVIRYDTGETVASVAELDAATVIFIGRRLECLNHKFVEELTAQAQQEDCGIAGPISVDADNRIVDSGLYLAENGELIDAFAGAMLPDLGYMGISKVVHQVAIVRGCFAVKTDAILNLGGIQRIVSENWNVVGLRFSLAAQALGQSVLVTPYAIATVCDLEQDLDSERQADEEIIADFRRHSSQPLSGRLNPNLCQFANLRRILTTGTFEVEG
jgi:hypothetical protein